jgi:hypothetical protein
MYRPEGKVQGKKGSSFSEEKEAKRLLFPASAMSAARGIVGCVASWRRICSSSGVKIVFAWAR